MSTLTKLALGAMEQLRPKPAQDDAARTGTHPAVGGRTGDRRLCRRVGRLCAAGNGLSTVIRA
jgi:hypothetical protein